MDDKKDAARIVHVLYSCTMGFKKPHRQDVIDREFPVRLTIQSDPATFEITRQWLQRNVGTGNYASKPQVLWSARRAQCVYFRNLHDALMFVAGCPHVQLIGERYTQHAL